MRDFGSKQKEFYEFSINGTAYKVPLPASLGPVTQAKFQQAAGQGEAVAFPLLVEFFHRYVGDALDEITSGEFAELIQEWNKAGEEQGASLGES